MVKIKASKLSLTGGFPEVLVFTNQVAYNVPEEVQRLIKGIAYIDHVSPALQGIIRRISIANPVAKNPPTARSHQSENQYLKIWFKVRP